MPGRPEGRYCADWLDEEDRRLASLPALDTDILLWVDPTRLIRRSLEAVADRDHGPSNDVVVLDENLGEVARLSP